MEKEIIAMQAELTQVKKILALMGNTIPAAAPKPRLLSEQRQKTKKAQRKVLLPASPASLATLPLPRTW